MATDREPVPGGGRRLLAALLTAACLFTASALTSGLVAVQAAQDPGPGLPCHLPHCSPTPGPAASPTTCFDSPEFCPPSPSPTPTVIEVSPVPPDPTPSPTVEPYLRGINPTPSPTPQTTDSISSPVPVGGGFVDQLPSPSAAPAAEPASSLAPHSSGLPLPFLAVGAVLILGAIGSLLFAIVPRNKSVFDTPRRGPTTSPVMFTPYGPDAPTNLVGSPEAPRPGPK